MKILVFKKTILTIVVAVVIFFSTFLLNLGVVDVSSAYSATNKRLPIYSVKTDENKVAISFDAAWGADKTTEIMNVCDNYNVKATFFLVGFWIDKYPEKVKEIYNRGFEIGIHSNTHPDMTKLNKKQIREELEININKIVEITGQKPKLFRPPYGYYNNNLIDVCDELGLSCIEWSVDSLDWKGLTASELSGRVISKSKKGSIVLFHNNSDNIIEGLKMCLEYFKKNNTKVVPIGEMICYQDFYIDNQGAQIKK
jgi:peptidoglycan/xylan/chitin deacetylase (PgdA/CDA1 family)